METLNCFDIKNVLTTCLNIYHCSVIPAANLQNALINMFLGLELFWSMRLVHRIEFCSYHSQPP